MRISSILGFSDADSQSTHRTYYKTIACNHDGVTQHVIFKKNKHTGAKGQQSSALEACFTALANLTCAPHRALQQAIVLNYDGKICGIASEHAAHALLRMHAQKPSEQFLLTERFLPSREVSSEEFTTWLNSHKPISGLVADTTTYSEELQEKKHKEHVQRLNHYIQEQLDICQFNTTIAPDALKELSHYCQTLLANNKNLMINEAPEQLRKEPRLLAIVYEKERLEKQYNEHLEQNTTQAMQVSSLGQGRGFNFLDKVPQNFFAELLAAKKRGEVAIDMDSIADVLTTAYGLEEDDLHKANIGYYVTLSDRNIPCFHFFKIDHDLLFNEHLMASRNPRYFNFYYNATRRNFAITAKDLLGFPDLIDSGNHYWPTKKTFFAKGKKAYQNQADRDAYKALKDDPEFEQAKWARFLKQVILPHQLINKSIHHPLTVLKDSDEINGTASLVHRALSTRLAELRTVLLSISRFRDFLNCHHAHLRITLLKELDDYAQQLHCTAAEIKQVHLEVDLALDALLIASALHTPQTTLHTTIITQGYRCYETSAYFKQHLNNKDSDGLTPMDHALDQYKIYKRLLARCTQEQHPSYQQMVTYFADVLCDLHRAKAQHTITGIEYQALITQAHHDNSMHQLPTVTSLSEYLRVITDMRQQPNRSLKQDKVYAVALLEKATLSVEELEQLKKQLAAKEIRAPLTFIKELRSELYLVKLIRGAYGYTTTLAQLNECIDNKLRHQQQQPTH